MTGIKYIKIGLVLIALLAGFGESLAQLNKANKYFSNEQYQNAITSYEKVLKKDTTNKEAIQNIAFSYKKLKDYSNAEVYYAKAIVTNPQESSNVLYYGQTLKNNGKVAEAKVQFQKFVESNPNHFIGKLMVQSCSDISSWGIDEKAFKVTTVPNINTKDADFCPLVYKDGIVFVSERGVDLVNENSSGMSNKPYLSIFYAQKEKEYKKAKHFSNQLNSLYHDGPVSISSDQQVIYFSRVDKKEHGKDYTNKLKIFTASLDDKKWKNITPFEYNSTQYSVAHPWISEDNQQLFFASDMPGGFGGMDIYQSIKNGETWGKPINLGRGINTAANEIFPYFRKGKLYFSSEGHSGYGGLDIYVTLQEENWATAENLKAPLNSPKDDFGIFYKDDENGYFSSNRVGGVGSDDIYAFNWHLVTAQTQLAGLLEYDKLPAAGISINLLDEEDNIISTTTTDQDGKFVFDKLAQDKNYLLAIDSEDDSFLENSNLFLTNSKGEKVLMANRESKGRFKFQALPHDDYEALSILVEEDESLFDLTVYGQVYQILPGDYSVGMEVWMVDDEGNVVGKTTTDENGKFFFEKLPGDKTYVYRLAENDEALNLVFLDQYGHLKPLAEEDGSLFDLTVFGQVYQILPGDYSAGMEVWMVDDEGNVVGKTKTDENGKFFFEKLPADKTYGYRLAENDEDLNIVFLDEKGDLEPLAEEDKSLFNLNVQGQIYKKLPGDYSGGMAVWAVDDEGNILGKTTTDENGAFFFEKLAIDKSYLFRLAEDDEELNIIFVDENGKIEESAQRLLNGQYRYLRLASDKNVITLINEIDEVIKIEENENFIISKVLYDFASDEINDAAAVELGKLVLILQKNKHIGVELSSHTDSKGGKVQNMQLSQRRADAAVRYVVSKGIDKKKIVAKGFGETMPVAPNEINGKDNPDGRAKNRRTEFKVIVL
jgi:outer membrane protein OmpA-like peptidoglycan-associated protein/tetratricopeptide (TPR) repeat protein